MLLLLGFCLVTWAAQEVGCRLLGTSVETRVPSRTDGTRTSPPLSTVREGGSSRDREGSGEDELELWEVTWFCELLLDLNAVQSHGKAMSGVPESQGPRLF